MANSPSSLEEVWKPLRLQIEEQLKQCLDRLSADCPDPLREAMAYSLLAGGKRLRPILVLLASEACGGTIDAALPAACAIEMVHTYSLIHDDLPAMDDDALRRGRPTSHIQFGEALAILAGDALLTLAFEIVANGVTAPQTAAACCADLAQAAGAAGMVGGQVVDWEAENLTECSLEHLESIHRRKTGALLTSSLTLGARIGGADLDTIEIFRKYGKSVGLAFQITDDLLDRTGNPETIGKAVRKDQEQGKLTYPALLGIAESRRRAEILIDTAKQCIAPLGDRGRRLEQLAQFVLERDH